MATAVDFLIVGAVTAVLSGTARILIEGAVIVLFLGALRLLRLSYDQIDRRSGTELRLVSRRLLAANVFTLVPPTKRDQLGTYLIVSLSPLIIGWTWLDTDYSHQDDGRVLYLFWTWNTRRTFLRPDSHPVDDVSPDKAGTAAAAAPAAVREATFKLTHMRCEQDGIQSHTMDRAAPLLLWPRLDSLLDMVQEEVGGIGGAVILTGPTGVGKSTVALHLAARLAAAGRNPRVILGVELSSYCTLEWIVERYGVSYSTPLILVFDEFDVQVEQALRGQSDDSTPHTCKRGQLAANKTQLSALLDRATDYEHLCIVATSNRGYEWWAAEDKSFVIRTGRFDLHLAIDALSLDDANAACTHACGSMGITPVPRLLTTPLLGDLATACRKVKGLHGPPTARLVALRRRLEAWL